MSCYQPKNILVTGGAGFVGSNFIRYLLGCNPNVRVVNLDLLTYAGSLRNLTHLPSPDRHQFVQGDIGDREKVDWLLRENVIDTVVHFAADSHVDRSINDPTPFVRTNILGTYTLLEALRSYWLKEKGWSGRSCRLHHISTDEVFGTLQDHDPPFHEASRYAPNSPYAATKAGSDHLVRAYHHTFNLPVVSTHCSNNYGPFQHPEKWVPVIIFSCLRSHPIPIYGDGSNIRDWIYVEDHCRGIDAVLCFGRLGQCYHIGGGRAWSNVDLVRHICQIMDQYHPEGGPHDRLISFVNDRPGHDWRYAINTDKIQQELGWRPRETLDSGMRKTAAWYGDRPS